MVSIEVAVETRRVKCVTGGLEVNLPVSFARFPSEDVITTSRNAQQMIAAVYLWEVDPSIMPVIPIASIENAVHSIDKEMNHSAMVRGRRTMETATKP